VVLLAISKATLSNGIWTWRRAFKPSLKKSSSEWVATLHEKTKMKYLMLAGGVALIVSRTEDSCVKDRVSIALSKLEAIFNTPLLASASDVASAIKTRQRWPIEKIAWKAGVVLKDYSISASHKSDLRRLCRPTRANACA
jgi:hypothetical protein